jgi:hypothetical protein
MIGTSLVLHTAWGNPAPAYNDIAVFSLFNLTTGIEIINLFYHFY